MMHMVNRKIISISIILLILPIVTFAHEAETVNRSPFLEPVRNDFILYPSVFIIILAVIASVLRPKMGNFNKKAFFVMFAVAILSVTAYLDAVVLYTNYVSVTHGPIHWHAAIDFTICGKDMPLIREELAEDESMHTHGDGLIHIETTPITWEDLEIHHFFEDIGGEFTNTSLTYPSENGTVNVKNGDLCPDGHPGTLLMYVNGRLEPKMDSYIISPVESQTVGLDKILIVFD